MIPDRNVLLHFSIFLEITTVSRNIFITNIFAPYLKSESSLGGGQAILVDGCWSQL